MSHRDFMQGAAGDDVFFIFGDWPEFVSVCAPRASTKAEVEAFADTKFPDRAPFESIDKAEFGKSVGVHMGGKTPNPCNWEPADRTHWFLMRVRAA